MCMRPPPALCLLLCACASESTAPPPGDPPPSGCPDLDEKFEAARARFERDLADHAVPGGAIAVVCGGGFRSAGVGVTRAGGDPVAATTRFEIASLSKMLTARAALSLVDDGVIDLQAPVTAILPQLGYGEVTLHHLMTHGSGLPTVPTRFDAQGLVELVVDNADLAPWTPPGAVWNYNNLGYAIVGALLEQASGKPFPDLVDERVFTPLGMDGATMRASELTADVAHGHSGMPSNPALQAPASFDDPTLAPEGGGWASVDDLARFVMAPDLGRQMQRFIRTGEYPEESYGYGFILDDAMTPPLAAHGGSIEGFLSDVLLVPDEGVGAIALVNADWWYPSDATLEAVRSLVDVTIPAPPPPPSPDRLAGVYDSTVFGEIEVRAEGSGAVVDFHAHGYSAPLQSVYYRIYEVEWRPESMTIPVTFWFDDETGPASHIVSRAGVATRR